MVNRLADNGLIHRTEIIAMVMVTTTLTAFINK